MNVIVCSLCCLHSRLEFHRRDLAHHVFLFLLLLIVYPAWFFELNRPHFEKLTTASSIFCKVETCKFSRTCEHICLHLVHNRKHSLLLLVLLNCWNCWVSSEVSSGWRSIRLPKHFWFFYICGNQGSVILVCCPCRHAVAFVCCAVELKDYENVQSVELRSSLCNLSIQLMNFLTRLQRRCASPQYFFCCVPWYASSTSSFWKVLLPALHFHLRAHFLSGTMSCTVFWRGTFVF